MRNLNLLDRYRLVDQEIIDRFGSPGDHTCGAFEIPLGAGRNLHIIASIAEGWEHVSVSLADRCPYWSEMVYVKNMFFEPEDLVLQYHPPKSKHINFHPYCLHLWRSTKWVIPMPPVHML